MIKLYFAPRTRSVRILWLLEELELPYELARVEFAAPAERFFAQQTPLGKLPTIEDGDVVMCESGAIVEYILERYGGGRLAPPVGSRERAAGRWAAKLMESVRAVLMVRPEADPDNVRHTLILLEQPPLERLRRSLNRVRAVAQRKHRILASKRAANRAKDRLVIPVLEDTLAASQAAAQRRKRKPATKSKPAR
jgi:glutathione S-transferase